MRRNGVKMVPPDGGWGWFIVFGSSLINLSTRAIEPSFGLLFGDLLKDLGVHTTGASFLIATLNAVINFSGLFVGPLIKSFSYRKVALVGGVLSAVSLILTSYANSMIHILITFGLIGGVGFGLATACTLVGINSYFSKKKGQAVGLSMAGTAMGFMTMPQVVSFLLSEYDFRSALLILGAVSLHSVVGAMLFQPVKWHLRPTIPIEETKDEEPLRKLLPSDRKLSLNYDNIKELNNATGKLTKTSSYPSSSLLDKRKPSIISNVSHVDITGSSVHIDVRDIHEEDEEEDNKLNTKNSEKLNDEQIKALEKIVTKEEESGCWDKFCKLFDLNLLTDWVYLNILYGISICIVAEMNFKLVVPFFMEDLGYTKQEVAGALSLMAIADIAARVIVPPVFDRLTYSRKSTLIFGSLLVALCRSVFAEQTETVPLMVFLILHGFCRGMTLINFPLVLSEYATGDNFPAVLGLSMVAKGIFIVTLGPIAGIVRDATDSYPLYIHCQSIMMLTMVFAWGVELIFFNQNKKIESDIPPSKC